ncbi:protein CotJB [Paenibacillus montaniterrae]|uniref:Protein CotJB n=1 Tax=Paenibacillus montaniterrae TaxID=429341 RepID=A0A919YK28_9BACL|nr:spore coat protein CotJB [Paenibacillus montaniterrae]GIP14895.1 protein CotJB [Paenibacillus montaniterrae]
MSIQLDEAYYTLLHELQAIDFVLVELTLYLDTHPHDDAALQQFNQFAELRKKVAHHYEANYGPLLQFGRSPSPGSWKWSEPPWPWQV